MNPSTEQDYQRIIQQQQSRIAELEKKVQELSAQVARLSKNSANLSGDILPISSAWPAGRSGPSPRSRHLTRTSRSGLPKRPDGLPGLLYRPPDTCKRQNDKARLTQGRKGAKISSREQPRTDSCPLSPYPTSLRPRVPCSVTQSLRRPVTAISHRLA